MQRINQYPALLDDNEGSSYNLGSQECHNLKYVPLNWKRTMEEKVKDGRNQMHTKL